MQGQSPSPQRTVKSSHSQAYLSSGLQLLDSCSCKTNTAQEREIRFFPPCLIKLQIHVFPQFLFPKFLLEYRKAEVIGLCPVTLHYHIPQRVPTSGRHSKLSMRVPNNSTETQEAKAPQEELDQPEIDLTEKSSNHGGSLGLCYRPSVFMLWLFSLGFWNDF